MVNIFSIDYYQAPSDLSLDRGVSTAKSICSRQAGIINPTPSFRTSRYVATNPEILGTEQVPFLHFLFVIVGESALDNLFLSTSLTDVQTICEQVDTEWYLYSNPDVQTSGLDAFIHYMVFGWQERRDPSPEFSTSAYLGRYPEIAEGGVNPFLHWVLYGKAEGRSCEPVIIPLYLVSFSGRLTQHAEAARTELQKRGATKLWDDVWVVEMDRGPEACLPGFLEMEAALYVPLDGSKALFSIGRAAGIAAQLAYTENVAPRLRANEAISDSAARVCYCNDGAAVFEPLVAQYFSARRHSHRATDLCRLMAGHGSDKGIGWHTYTPFYQALFSDRRETVSAFFELGLGTNNEDTPSNMGAHGKPSASLRGWHDYFPNARIFGGDVDKRVLFAEDRIETFFVDQCDPSTFEALWANIPDIEFDVFLDDGLHTFEAARVTFTHAIDKVKSGGFYIIEDVMKEDLESYLNIIKERGLPGLSIDIDHPANCYDNCLIVAAVA